MWPQNFAVAAIVRQLLPHDFVRTIMVDADSGSFIDLPAGVTIADLESEWKHIDEDEFVEFTQTQGSPEPGQP